MQDTFVHADWFMVCCAADAMPAAVKIETLKTTRRARDEWLKVTGVVHFPAAPEECGDDGIDYGDYPEPVIVAETIIKIQRAARKIPLLAAACSSFAKLFFFCFLVRPNLDYGSPKRRQFFLDRRHRSRSWRL